MSIKSYITNKLRPNENKGIALLCLIPLVFVIFYALSFYTNSSLLLNIGIYICGILSFIPLALMRAIFLLWMNPAKYKEYEAKQLSKQLSKKRAEERNKYLMISFCILLLEVKNEYQVGK